MRDLLLVIAFLIVLFILWVIFIKVPGDENSAGRFIKPLQPVDTGEVHNERPFRSNSE